MKSQTARSWLLNNFLGGKLERRSYINSSKKYNKTGVISPNFDIILF